MKKKVFKLKKYFSVSRKVTQAFEQISILQKEFAKDSQASENLNKVKMMLISKSKLMKNKSIIFADDKSVDKHINKDKDFYFYRHAGNIYIGCRLYIYNQYTMQECKNTRIDFIIS